MMYSLRFITQQFGSRQVLTSFKFRHLATSLNHVCGRLHQKNDDTKNVLPSKYIWSRNYKSQTFKEFNEGFDMLEKLIVQEKESADYKKNIINLLSFYYNFENKIGQNEVDTSILIMDLYQRQVLRRSNDFIPKIGKHLAQSEDFKKLLETLPNHIENISIADQLDNYIGLLLLGVQETDSSMNHLFCNFYKTDSELGLSEVAKMAAIFRHKTRSDIPIKTIVLPKFKYLLKEQSIHNQGDCKNISLILQNGEDLDFESKVEASKQMLSDADQFKDIDLVLQMLNAVFSCGVLKWDNYKNKREIDPLFYLLKKYLIWLEPHVKNLTSSQISDFFTEFKKYSVSWLALNNPKIFKSFSTRISICSEEVLSGDLTFEEKMNYLHTLQSFYFKRIGKTTKKEQTIFPLICQSLPESNLKTLYHTCFIFAALRSMDVGPTYYINSVIKICTAQLLRVLHSEPAFFVEMDGVHILDCLEYLFNPKSGPNPMLLEFAPYIAWLLRSGHVCHTRTFFKACKFSIPLLGHIMPLEAKQRIWDFVLSVNASRTHHLAYVIEGALLAFVINKKAIGYADKVIRQVSNGLLLQKLNTGALSVIIFNLKHLPILTPYVSESTSSFTDLKKTIANQIVIDDNNLHVFMGHAVLPFVSEKNANIILKKNCKKYNANLYVQKSSLNMLLSFLFMFYKMSRYPKDKQMLEEFSQKVLSKNFPTLSLDLCFLYLLLLCYLDIYLDQYLLKIFSEEYLAKIDQYLESLDKFWKKEMLVLFAALNKEVVLHRKHLNIPWISDHILDVDILNSFGVNKKLCLKETVPLSEVEVYLKSLLGGSAFLKSKVKGKYGVDIDFELYLNSTNEPMVSEMVKRVDHSKKDVEKVAVHISRETVNEYLADDPEEVSMYNSVIIKDLKALGYRVELVQGHKWYALSNEERYDFLKEKIFKKKM